MIDEMFQKVSMSFEVPPDTSSSHGTWGEESEDEMERKRAHTVPSQFKVCRDCCAESNYVGSENVQSYQRSNCDLILSRIERGENVIKLYHCYSAL